MKESRRTRKWTWSPLPNAFYRQISVFFFTFKRFLMPQAATLTAVSRYILSSLSLFTLILSRFPSVSPELLLPAPLASSLIDNSQQGPSQGDRPDSLPSNTPRRLRAVVQAFHNHQLYRHHKTQTGSCLPAAQHLVFKLQNMRIHKNVYFSHMKSKKISSTLSVWQTWWTLIWISVVDQGNISMSRWGFEQSAKILVAFSFSAFPSFSISFLKIKSRLCAISRCMQNEGSSKRSDAVHLDALAGVWRASDSGMLYLNLILLWKTQPIIHLTLKSVHFMFLYRAPGFSE